MAEKTDLTAQLKKFFGFDTFKGEQEAIIRNLMAGNDTFVLMPTGGGKSLCYQLPSLLMEGTAIVISPLIALMKNQVDAIRNVCEEDGVAHFINSSLTKAAIDQVKSDILSGKTKLLYVAPESLTKEENVEFLKGVKISFYAVDEAHCISEWGHDFRPEYRRIRPIINEIGNAPVIALTATATDKVRSDIKKSLGIVDAKEFKSSFNRPNLYYEVRPKTKNIDKDIIRYIKNNSGKSGIIYCLSRKKVEELAEILRANNINARAYHAGMDSATRSATQDQFLMEKVDVIVATIAFGMGIDKPDVRTVIHTDCPDSLEAYFQEAGRAGRDGAKAYAVLLYNGADSRKLAKRIDDNFPEKEYIRKVYEHLAYFFQVAEGYGENITFEFNIEKFCHTFKHFPLRVNSALKILDRAGYIDYAEEQDNAARVMMTVTRDELYRLTNNTPNEDKVIITLLRSYGGLFSDFRFIDEGIVAQRAGLMQPQVHEALKALGRKRVLKFIPRRATPVVRYRRRREDPARLVFPKDAYEERRRQFAERIGAMMRYATNDDKCRSQQLLGYFGEDTAQPCGHCDVCLDSKGNPADTAGAEEVRAAIERLLGDGMRHHITELLDIKQPPETVDATLRRLIEEEHIYQEDGFIYKGH